MRFLLLCYFILSLNRTNAQTYLLPFSGFKCISNGIEPRDVEVQLNGVTWTSNYLPQNADFDIRLIEPMGLISVDSMYKPGIEVFIGTKNRDTLGYAANIYGDGFPGYNVMMFKRLSVTLGFGPEVMSGDSLFVKARFFDQHGPGSIIVEGMVVITDSTSQPETSTVTNYLKSYKGYTAASSGLVVKDMRVSMLEDERRTFEMKWSLQDVFALDLNTAETNVWLYFDDGSVKSLNRFEQFNYDFSTIPENTNNDVQGKISCYLNGYDLTSIQFVRVRTYSKSKGIVLDGIVELKKFL